MERIKTFGFQPQEDGTIALVAETEGNKLVAAMTVEQVDLLRDYAERMVLRYPGKTRLGVEFTDENLRM
jgi:hypothetical protein